MTQLQQEALIYKEKAFSSAQNQFEKDLKQRQSDGWRLISVTPTKKVGFGRIVQLTAIYEKQASESNANSVIPVSQPLEEGAKGISPIQTLKETVEENNTTKTVSTWEKIKESNRVAREKERAYQSTLNPEQLRKRKRRNVWVGVAILLVVLAVCSGITHMVINASNSQTAINGDLSSQLTDTPISTTVSGTPMSFVSSPTVVKPTPTPTIAKPTPTPTPQYASFGDGIFQVGTDIQPGTYRTRNPSPGCYYARLSGFGGSVGDIIANDNTDYPAIVTIEPGDKGFESQNCDTWTKDLSAITTDKTTFSDGTYFVGTDIASGTYKNTGMSGCYYATLSGFGGTTDNIISNNNTDSAAIVTIDSSAKGFESKNCGTWTKIG